MIKNIDSVNNPIIKEACKLKLLKYSKKEKEFLIEGFHILEMGIKANMVVCVFTLKKLDISDNITQYIVNERIINKLSTLETSQGVVAKCKYLEAKMLFGNTIVYLENVKDPGNLGTILRTCLAFNIKDVIISPDSVSVYNDKVIMASQGAIFSLNIVSAKLQDILKNFEDYDIISTTLGTNSVYLEDFKIQNEKNIIVFGNESKGIEKETIKISNHLIKIKISNIDSLNVGVAAGIILNAFKKF